MGTPAGFDAHGKTVLTFVGYSGAGYEHPSAMLALAERVLGDFEPATTLVAIGATPDGIGAVYELARRLGFETAGIVSTQARQTGAVLSAFVDRVWFVDDDRWGGLVPGTDRLSPTSQAAVDCSDVLVGIGGGEVARDELLAARRLGKSVKFFPADLDHQKARDQAQALGRPAPTDFRGAAHAALSTE